MAEFRDGIARELRKRKRRRHGSSLRPALPAYFPLFPIGGGLVLALTVGAGLITQHGHQDAGPRLDPDLFVVGSRPPAATSSDTTSPSVSGQPGNVTVSPAATQTSSGISPSAVPSGRAVLIPLRSGTNHEQVSVPYPVYALARRAAQAAVSGDYAGLPLVGGHASVVLAPPGSSVTATAYFADNPVGQSYSIDFSVAVITAGVAGEPRWVSVNVSGIEGSMQVGFLG